MPFKEPTIREAYNRGEADLTKSGYYKLGAEGGDWMDKVSFSDALFVDWAEMTEAGRQENTRRLWELEETLGLPHSSQNVQPVDVSNI